MPFEPGDHDSKVWIPETARAQVVKERGATVIIDNQTDLNDDAVRDYFVENPGIFGQSETFANYGFGQETRYLSYAGEGTMMARSKWRPPRNVIEEISIARDLIERDDDCSATVGTILAAAYSAGYRNQHEDEQVEHTFGEMSEDIGLRHVLHEMHRELLISSQINTVTVFTREQYDIRPESVTRVLRRSVAAPRVAVLPAEAIRVVGSDLFGEGTLGYVPDGILATWLREFFNSTTSPGRKREMAMQDPLAAALFVGKLPVNWTEMGDSLLSSGMDLYALNPDMVHRSTMAKGSWRYPRPLLTRNLALLEAKRLLTIMDHAMLQGGINYIVVVKKGDKDRPATQPELTNLQGIVQRASRSGVLIGDHRVSLEVVQPDLKQMLDPEKRRMVGRKLSQALLRVPEFGSDETGNAVQTFTELAQAVVTDDRAMVIDHLHRYVWRACMKRNASVFTRTDRPTVWVPKVILQGMDFWTQYLLKLYDRGDLPRKYMVEFGGYDYEAVMAQKQREVEGGHDDIFTPPPVPFSSPNQGPGDPYQYGNPAGLPSRQPAALPGPQDNGSGRPRGARDGSGGAGGNPARPSRVVRRTPGETVRAEWNDEEQQVVRIGEVTERVLSEYPQAVLGRLTASEREALAVGHTRNVGNVIVIPVNRTVRMMEDIQAVRLDENFSMLVGRRAPDGAIMACGFCFREPKVTVHEAEDMVIRWGFDLNVSAGSMPDDAPSDSGIGSDRLLCPSCGDSNGMDAQSCSNCGFDGPPFDMPMNMRRSVMPSMPIALTVNIDGHSATVEGQAVGRYVWVTCPDCGLVQDSTHQHCARCGKNIEGEVRKLLGDPNRPPERHLKPPPPATQQIDLREAVAIILAKGGVEPGKYVYLKCPECGLVQDAANSTCKRCGHDLTEARKGMFATLNRKGEKPTLHSAPPPPASEQPDLRKRGD